jgi:hypothetical protein
MSLPVHILVTCRKPELAPFSELVFKTLRIGFPTSDIKVYFNRRTTLDIFPDLKELVGPLELWTSSVDTIHHEWIKGLIESETEPFWICDTDIIFYDSFEDFRTDEALAGFRTPEWQDDFAGAITRSRLHPSLMYINPTLVKQKLAAFRSVCPDSPFTPFCNPTDPLCLPLNGRMYFHDTMSLMYHAIGGHEFSDVEKDKYFHFFFGSIPDLVLPRLKDREKMAEARFAVMNNPELGRGAWRMQEEYFAAKQPSFSKDLLIPETSPENAKAALEWNIKLCKGNTDAMHTSDMWYQYCHGIDDILDKMKDGRPQMSRAQILSVFFKGLLFYNSTFYTKHREHLCSTAAMTHNMYADSVEWERSSLRRRRTMADVMRTCGNEMYFMIALLVGGESHMREMSLAIRERDWLGQHDSDDRPN